MKVGNCRVAAAVDAVAFEKSRDSSVDAVFVEGSAEVGLAAAAVVEELVVDAIVAGVVAVADVAVAVAVAVDADVDVDVDV